MVPLLGIKAFMGALPPDDATEDRSPTGFLISYEFWKRRFEMDLSIINHTVILNGHRFTVVGVTPPGFVGTNGSKKADIQVPLSIMKAFGSPVLHANRVDPMIAVRYE